MRATLDAANDKLVKEIANRCARYVNGSYLSHEDLIQQGHEQLLRCQGLRNPTMSDLQFKHYTQQRVWGAVMDHVRANWRHEFSTDDSDRPADRNGRSYSADNAQSYAQLSQALDKIGRLSKRDQQVAALLLSGLQGKDAAAIMGTTPTAISQAKLRLKAFFLRYIDIES